MRCALFRDVTLRHRVFGFRSFETICLSVLRGWECPLKMRPYFFNFSLRTNLTYVLVYQMAYSFQVFRLRFWLYFSSLPQVPHDFSPHYPVFYILIYVKIKQKQLIISPLNSQVFTVYSCTRETSWSNMYIPIMHFCNYWCKRLSLQKDLLHDTINVPATSTDIVGFRNISKTE